VVLFKMNILIIGLPGSGKGTQSDLIVEQFKIKHLSTGNIFRNELKIKSQLGLQLKEYFDNGKLVPDELTTKLLTAEMQKDDYANGILFDGYPRTLPQAKSLESILSILQMRLPLIIYLKINEAIVERRLSGRIICPQCQKTYNLSFHPPLKKNICDDCGSELMTREDDTPEKVKLRIEIAKTETIPLIEFYKSKYEILEIECSDLTVDEVFSEIERGIKKYECIN